MRRRQQASEQGAALVLALILITVVSVGLLGLGSLVDTGVREARATQSQADKAYAADGAVDVAVDHMRDDSTLGIDGSPASCDYAVPDGTFPSVTGVTVACTPQSGSGAVSGGSGNASNTPDLALLATGTTETGIQVSGNSGASGQGFLVNGPVQANSPLTTGNGAISVTGGAALTVTGGTLKTAGSCTGAGTYSPACTTGSAPRADYSSDSKWDYDTLPTNVITPVTATVCAAATPTLAPGVYQSASVLSAITSSSGPCAGKVINFTSGTYLFDFPTGSSTWNMTGASSASQIHVIGGQLSTTPTVSGSACKSSTSTPAATDGVQFVFNGESHVNVQGAHVELCAKPNTTKQQIAIYGKRTVTTTTTSTGSTGALVPSGYTNGSGQAVFETTPTEGRVIDTKLASHTGKQTGRYSVKGFDFSAIPSGATITSVKATVAYKAAAASVTSLTMAMSAPTSGTVSSGSPCTSTGFCLDGTLRTDTFTLSGTFTPASLTTSTQLDFVANMANDNAAIASLDGATLTVNWSTTTTTTTGASGCLTVVPYGAAGSCALLSANGSSAAVSIHGTVYAWDSAIDVNVPNDSVQVLQRGAVARVFKINVPNSFASTQPLVSLPSGGPAVHADRDVVFIVTINGVRYVRARVKFSDTWVGPVLTNTQARVLAWSTS